MNKAIISIMLLIMSINSFSQQINSPGILNKETYLQKSKNQKTEAWVLLGGGTLLIGTGFLIGDGKESSFDDAATGAIIGGIGFLSAVGSIPLFIASGKNKRRSMKASAYIKMESVSPIGRYSAFQSHIPALSVKIKL